MIIIARLCSLVSFVFFSMQAVAYHPTIDVYGTNEITQNKIIQQFSSDIKQCAKPPGFESDSVQKQFKLKKKIIEGIHKVGNFAYVDIVFIQYSDLTDIFTTVDLIEKTDEKRVAYLLRLSGKIPVNRIAPRDNKADRKLNSLISKWFSYEQDKSKVFNKIFYFSKSNCPAYHCLPGGFDHPLLKQYQDEFATEVQKNKYKLVETLQIDPNEYKRGASAFLLAHIQDGQELINILMPSLFDPSKYVRNNVMRVLGAAVAIVKPIHFDLNPIIMALDFPSATDRNKALYIIDSLTDQRQYALYVSQFAGEGLIASLKMRQPNLHDYAYKILTKISGKFYGDRDYILWENWLDQKKNISFFSFNN